MDKFDPRDNNPSYPAIAKMEDDGLPYRCKECNQLANASEMLFTMTPNGKRGAYHRSCLDEEWLRIAVEIELVWDGRSRSPARWSNE